MPATDDGLDGDAAERAHQVQVAGLEGQGHQGRAGLRHPDAEPPGDIMGKAGGAHLGDRQAAGRHDNGLGSEIVAVGLDAESVATVDRGDPAAEPQINPGGLAFGQQHGDDLVRRTVAEQLPEGLLVIGDAVFLDQGDEILRGIAGQRRAAEMGIARQEAFRRAAQVGEVAAAAAGNDDLLARFVGMIDQQHLATPLAGPERAHQASGAGADNRDIERGPGARRHGLETPDTVGRGGILVR